MKAVVELDIPTDSREGLRVTSAFDNLLGGEVGCSNKVLLVPAVVSLQKKQISGFRAGWQTSYFRKEITSRETSIGIVVKRAGVLHYLCLEKTHFCPQI